VGPVDEDELVIAQLGLLFTQVHYARIALEGIERATTRYAGIALAMPGSSTGGTPWGAPPMLDGALKVYVVNIADLTAGASIGDVIAGVIGGAGRFLGGFAGGIAGGAIGGIAFPWMLSQASQLVASLDRILARLGLGDGSPPGAGGPGGAGGTTLADQLQSLRLLLRDMTALFSAAAGGPDPGAAASAAGPGGLLSSMQPALAVAVAATHLVNGLIILLPLVIGALASLLNHLGLIEIAVLDLGEFGLRVALLLRAAVLGAVLDTVSLVGGLAATTLGLITTALDTIIPSVFRLVLAGLDTALTLLQIASTGLKNLIDALMLWLRDGLGSMLIFIGNLRVFRLIEHLTQVAPYVLPAIARLMDKPLSKEETQSLTLAGLLIGPGGGGGSGGPSPSPTIPKAPDAVGLLLPPAARTAMTDSVRALGTSFAAETKTTLSAVQGTLGGIGTTFRTAVDGLDATLGGEVGARARIAGADVDALHQSLEQARAAARERPRTGLEEIAKAYEDWLRGGGMTTLLTQLDQHLRTTPVPGPDTGTSIPGRTVRAVLADQGDRRVVVEIDEVVIELGPEPPAAPSPQYASTGYDPEAHRAWEEEIEDRAGLRELLV
jgi:hypothetical protein